MFEHIVNKQVTVVKPISTLPPKPLNSNEAFRYLNYSWRFIGMAPPKRFRLLYYSYALFIIIFSAIMMPVSMLANIYFIDNLQTVLANLSLSLTFVIATLKQLAIFINHDSLKKASQYLPLLDVRCEEHTVDRSHILFGIKLCHIIYAVYMTLNIATGYGLVIVGYSQHQLVQNGWFPQLVDDPEINYLLAFSYQTIAQTFTIFQNAYSDMYPQCYMAIMIAHIRALVARIERIGKDVSRSQAENQEELQSCIQDHKNILGYFQCISTVIASTIFLQFLVTGFVLCLTAINMMLFQSNFAQMFVTFMYLVIILGEVFPCCWFANLMMDETNRLTNAMYSCNWYEQDRKFRKTLIIFMQRSQLANVILAGNMAPVSLQTFVAIIKFSFSMFTILSKMKIE